MKDATESPPETFARRLVREAARKRFLWRLSVLLPDVYHDLESDDVARMLRNVRGAPLFVSGEGRVTDEHEALYPYFAADVAYPFSWTLAYPDYIYGGQWSSGSDVGVFDPRVESIDDAVKRLLPELECRLRATLIHMAHIDAGVDSVSIFRRATDRHFDWLIRYQLSRESMSKISQLDGVDRRAISRAIHGAADLIGLALRDPSPPGRPRKK